MSNTPDHYRLRSVILHEGFIIFIRKCKGGETSDEIVRYYYHTPTAGVVWDVLLPQPEGGRIIIDELLEPSEELLFQLRCTVSYNVDIVLELLNVLKQYQIIDSGDLIHLPPIIEIKDET